jgi:hypothetical protein
MAASHFEVRISYGAPLPMYISKIVPRGVRFDLEQTFEARGEQAIKYFSETHATPLIS